MQKKNVIIEVLESAGFKQHGTSQFKHKSKGTLFMKEYTCEELTDKLMSIGAQHKTHELKQALNVSEDWMFNPQA